MKRSWIILASAIVVGLAVIVAVLGRSASMGAGYGLQYSEDYSSSRPRLFQVPREVPASFIPSLVRLQGAADSGSTYASIGTQTSTTMIIRNGQASIRVDSLEPAIAAVRSMAERLGGRLANTSLRAGDRQLRSATLEVKVPAERFDEAIGALTPIGQVEEVSIAAQDVGEEFVDVTARMENARRLERRLVDILANRTGKLGDVLDVEQALARVRGEIERSEGRRRYLQAHAAMSSLMITVHEPAPLVGERGTSLIGESFAQAWRNFVWLVALAIQALGIVLPLGLVVAAAWFAVMRRRHVAARTTAL